jgi:hypothetical protein
MMGQINYVKSGSGQTKSQERPRRDTAPITYSTVQYRLPSARSWTTSYTHANATKS